MGSLWTRSLTFININIQFLKGENMKTDFEFLTTEIDGHILTVTINRPEVMNALHPPAHAEFDDCLLYTSDAADE